MKNTIKDILIVVVIITLSYLFLSLCNWSFSLKEWNGFSRFLLGIPLFLSIFYFADKLK